MEPFSVVVPYRAGEPCRDRSWRWVRERWLTLVPEAELVLGSEDGKSGDDAADYNHPLAINRGVAMASHDVIVVADADTAFDPEWIRLAVTQVRTGQARWALPLEYRKIDKESSDVILRSHPSTETIPPHSSDWIGQWRWSGLVVVPRAGFDAAGGYDERYAWWGADDHSFGITMTAMWGEPTWIEGGVAYHLWHPPQEERAHVFQGVLDNRKLHQAYIDASGDREAVIAVRWP